MNLRQVKLRVAYRLKGPSRGLLPCQDSHPDFEWYSNLGECTHGYKLNCRSQN